VLRSTADICRRTHTLHGWRFRYILAAATAANAGADIGENVMRHLLSAIALIAGIIGFTDCSSAKSSNSRSYASSRRVRGTVFGRSALRPDRRARHRRGVSVTRTIRSSSISTAPAQAQGLVRPRRCQDLAPDRWANGNRLSTRRSIAATSSVSALFNDSRSSSTILLMPRRRQWLLMASGYTIVWSGWQGDVVPGGGRMTFRRRSCLT